MATLITLSRISKGTANGPEVSGYATLGSEKREGVRLLEKVLNTAGDESAEENGTEVEAT